MQIVSCAYKYKNHWYFCCSNSVPVILFIAFIILSAYAKYFPYGKKRNKTEKQQQRKLSCRIDGQHSIYLYNLCHFAFTIYYYYYFSMSSSPSSSSFYYYYYVLNLYIGIIVIINNFSSLSAIYLFPFFPYFFHRFLLRWQQLVGGIT